MIIISILKWIFFLLFICFGILFLIEFIKLWVWTSKKKEKWITRNEYLVKSFRFSIYFIISGLAGFFL
ncbi:hypothetical protein AN964_22815 [Heyndrickxia shackletonii]|uniref:Uncharacterized protein n=1 Tax=Heyndrickxia shackletonii TaxID=157838 RepID=A0A0Q3WR44_9BACI|nr:hypothetical protein AN964_22815 [Heyndrickxia shackletonii]